MNNDSIKRLETIIRNYRKGEITIPLDENHILKWLNQFTPTKRRPILDETTFVFSEWYFDTVKIYSFLSETYDYVVNRYGSAMDGVCFLNCQSEGQSQSCMITMLSKLILSEEITTYNSNAKHLIYIDDGLYSGRHIIKDIRKLLENGMSTIVKSIDVFVLVGFSEGMSYVKKELEELCRDCNIDFNLYRWKELYNEKTVDYSNETETYFSNVDTLWPIRPCLNKDDDVKARIKKITGSDLHYCYRDSIRNYRSRVYSSEDNRRIVEQEFLYHGNKILTDESIRKGIYPLGFSSYPSLGFGSFLATDLNIPNTCPVVLWWGNIEKKGDALDCWYPLLPRRVN